MDCPKHSAEIVLTPLTSPNSIHFCSQCKVAMQCVTVRVCSSNVLWIHRRAAVSLQAGHFEQTCSHCPCPAPAGWYCTGKARHICYSKRVPVVARTTPTRWQRECRSSQQQYRLWRRQQCCWPAAVFLEGRCLGQRSRRGAPWRGSQKVPQERAPRTLAGRSPPRQGCKGEHPAAASAGRQQRDCAVGSLRANPQQGGNVLPLDASCWDLTTHASMPRKTYCRCSCASQSKDVVQKLPELHSYVDQSAGECLCHVWGAGAGEDFQRRPGDALADNTLGNKAGKGTRVGRRDVSHAPPCTDVLRSTVGGQRSVV